MKFTLAQIAGAASRGGLDGDDVMHDLLQLAERNGNTPTLREYFIASAPEHPQPWFRPVTSGAAELKDRYVSWPSAWADEQLRLLAARLIG